MKSNLRVIVIFLLLMYLFIEGSAYLGILIFEKKFYIPYDPRIANLSEQQQDLLRQFLARRDAQTVHQDPVLGWTSRHEENAAGMRDDREYALTPPAGVLRLAAFGDSFTFGSDVDLNDTWSRQLAAIRPGIEVLNYGAPGYGLDQAYLRYLQQGTVYRPHIVFLGYMSENIARSVNVFRAFYTPWYHDVIFTKPRFSVQNDKLVLMDNPVSTLEDHEYFLHNAPKVLARLGEHDYHYQINYNAGPFDFLPSVRFAKILWYYINKKFLNPIFTFEGSYNTESEAYQVTLKTFEAFYNRVIEDGALPVILIFPDTSDQTRARQKRPRRYAPLLEDFRARGYRYIDVLSAFEPYEDRYTVDQLTVAWGHYSPLGNRIVAAYIYAQLQAWGLTDPPAVRVAVSAEARRLGQAVH